MPRNAVSSLGTLARLHRIAVVGTGDIATRMHLPAYARRENLEVVMVCDHEADRAADAAERFGIPSFAEDIQAVLERDDIEIVDLAVPFEAHFDLTKLALKAGKHVLVQKPFVPTMAEARELIADAEVADVALAVCMDYRWIPTFAACGELMEEGWLGQPTLSFYEDHHREAPPSVHTEHEESLLLEHTLHKLDLFVAWFGLPDRVFANFGGASLPGAAGPGVVSVRLDFANGHHVLLIDDVSPTCPGFRRFLLQGTEGALRGDFERLERFRGGRERSAWREVACFGDRTDAFADTMQALCRAVERGGEPPHSAKNHLRTLAVVEAVRRSGREERVVSLSECAE